MRRLRAQGDTDAALREAARRPDNALLLLALSMAAGGSISAGLHLLLG